MLFVIIGHDGPDGAKLRPGIRPAHLENLRPLVAAGKVPRVVIPSEDGRPLRRLLVDLADLDRLIAIWKRT